MAVGSTYPSAVPLPKSYVINNVYGPMCGL